VFLKLKIIFAITAPKEAFCKVLGVRMCARKTDPPQPRVFLRFSHFYYAFVIINQSTNPNEPLKIDLLIT
jgi:hypothetical protein